MFVRGKIGIDALQNLETCTRDEDCDSSKLCTNGMCVIAGCNEECNVNEICQSKNRTFSCECIPDYSRDSDNKCRRQCSSNEICELNEQCQNGLCTPVVIYSDRCGLNAVGIHAPHKQLCACPRGFGGDPYRHCLKRCETDYECEDSEICHHNLCSNACLPSLKKCSYKQKCEVKNHTVDCLNEPSEYKSCETSGDCDEKSYCAGGQSLCIPLCDPQTCADNEFCHEKTFFSSEQFTLRGISCKCDANPILVHGSRKCHKQCDSDEICEENEYCNHRNWCVPRKH
ncbi:hypothetical protein PV328_011237 [Microctonus aethiopoides]|uniref:Uncharacterized protein n=1 Tax=Microctonus aethiopoides TaxID=144406 RepID=A0AA39C3Z5_9HYME|nr:hypothetical protein PV328_011237 [Microctonus aethiopoides]